MTADQGDAWPSEGSVKVLMIVEDDEDMRLLVRLTLRKDPRLQVLAEAAAATDALDVVATLEPGLIILDQGLGGRVSGLDLAPKLKVHAPRAKILLFTAYDMELEARRSPSIDAFLRKDGINRLLAVVQQLLGLPGELDT